MWFNSVGPAILIYCCAFVNYRESCQLANTKQKNSWRNDGLYNSIKAWLQNIFIIFTFMSQQWVWKDQLRTTLDGYNLAEKMHSPQQSKLTCLKNVCSDNCLLSMSEHLPKTYLCFGFHVFISSGDGVRKVCCLQISIKLSGNRLFKLKAVWWSTLLMIIVGRAGSW